MSKRIESEKLIIDCHSEKAYDFIGNFDNFSHLLPGAVQNWQSDGESCTFVIKGLPTLGLRITGKTPYSQISMIGEGKLPFGFTFDAFIEETSMQQCKSHLTIDADMNPFIATMAEKPLQNFIDMLINKLKLELEK